MFNFFRKNKLPDNAPKFLIIGAQKAGTTTLFDILNNIDIFQGSKTKELHFFDLDVKFEKGIDWYLSYFEKTRSKKNVFFEATRAYFYSLDAPTRIKQTLGKIKFIVLLRNPAERAYSTWNMFKKFNSDQELAQNTYNTFIKYSNEPNKEFIKSLLFPNNFPSFKECISSELIIYEEGSLIPEPSFLRRGIYHEQIIRYLKYFNLSDFCFIETRELENNTKEVLEKNFHFLNINQNNGKDSLMIISNKGKYTEALDINAIETLSFLNSFYVKHNNKLFQLIRKQYSW